MYEKGRKPKKGMKLAKIGPDKNLYILSEPDLQYDIRNRRNQMYGKGQKQIG